MTGRPRSELEITTLAQRTALTSIPLAVTAPTGQGIELICRTHADQDVARFDDSLATGW